MKILISSSKGTKAEDIIFVIEESKTVTTSKEKLRLVDVENELKNAQEQLGHLTDRIAELEDYKTKMTNLLKK